MVQRIIIDCETKNKDEGTEKKGTDMTIEYVDCPHRVPPGVDPDKWDAARNHCEKEQQ